jgi:hypothetical protein
MPGGNMALKCSVKVFGYDPDKHRSGELVLINRAGSEIHKVPNSQEFRGDLVKKATSMGMKADKAAPGWFKTAMAKG